MGFGHSGSEQPCAPDGRAPAARQRAAAQADVVAVTLLPALTPPAPAARPPRPSTTQQTTLNVDRKRTHLYYIFRPSTL